MADDRDDDNVVPSLQRMVAVTCLREYLLSDQVLYSNKLGLLQELLAPPTNILPIAQEAVLYLHPSYTDAVIFCSDKEFPCFMRSQDGTTCTLYLAISSSAYKMMTRKGHYLKIHDRIHDAAERCGLDKTSYVMDPRTVTREHLHKVWMTEWMRRDVLKRYVNDDKQKQRNYVLEVHYVRK